MPRSGPIYTLPEAAFVPNTPIVSAAVNADLSDIADALTNSLARDGAGGMTAVLPLDNTGFVYLSDPNTGMHRTGADTQAIFCGGVDALTVTPTSVDVPALTIAGAAAFPVPTAEIANSAVTYAKIQNVAPASLLGNATGAPIAPEEITLGAGLAFVGTVLTGSAIPPTIQIFNSGTAQTYTTPAGVKWLEVLLTGGGAGGGGGNSAVLSTAGGATSFGALTAGGGAGSSQAVPGAGGTASGGNVDNMVGAPGGSSCPSSTASNGLGAAGGCSQRGGAGAGGSGVGAAAATNSGSGGGGGASSNGSISGSGGCGGAGGGTVSHIYTSPAATYTYTVGPGGGPASGVNISSSVGFAGGQGAAGRIVVIEHY